MPGATFGFTENAGCPTQAGVAWVGVFGKFPTLAKAARVGHPQVCGGFRVASPGRVL